MNHNQSHPNPNVNPPDQKNELGSILKPALLALALLAVSGSLLHAMVVTKPVKFPPVTVQSKAVALTLAVSPNPCAVGATVTCKINLARIYDTNNDESITVDGVDIGGSIVTNDFIAYYQTPSTGGVHTVTASFTPNGG